MSEKEIQEQIEALHLATEKASKSPQKAKEYLKKLGLELPKPKQTDPPKNIKIN